MGFEVAPVVKLGERVGDGKLHGGVQAVAQALRKSLAPYLGPHPRDKLVAVDRTHEVVVDADIETAHDTGLVLGLRNHQDGCVARPLQRAQLAAQA